MTVRVIPESCFQTFPARVLAPVQKLHESHTAKVSPHFDKVRDPPLPQPPGRAAGFPYGRFLGSLVPGADFPSLISVMIFFGFSFFHSMVYLSRLPSTRCTRIPLQYIPFLSTRPM